MSKPAYGRTRSGLAVHARVIDHLPHAHAIDRFNSRVAVIITRAVGSMWCAYIFAAFDLISLPDALRSGTAAIISWVAQTFLQLVLLSIIMVGQDVQAKASDARAAKTFEDTERTLDLLDTDTEGGLQVIVSRLDAIERRLPGAPEG